MPAPVTYVTPAAPVAPVTHQLHHLTPVFSDAFFFHIPASVTLVTPVTPAAPVKPITPFFFLPRLLFIPPSVTPAFFAAFSF